MNKLFNKVICSIALVLGLYGTFASAQIVIAPYLQRVEFSTNIDYINSDPSAIFSNTVIIDNFSNANGSETPVVIRSVRDAQIDGYHRGDFGNKNYYSFNADTRVGGISVLKSDIIHCDDFACSSFTFFFDSDAFSLKHVNINAFTLDFNNGQLIFSIENDAMINGGLFLASDLIRFTGTGFSLEYDSTSDVFSRYKNIDALSLLPNNRYLVSFAVESTLHEIFSYNTANNVWGTAYTPLFFGNSFGQININSLMGIDQPVPELIFSDGFE